MMQVRWIIKTTPRVKKVLQSVIDDLEGESTIETQVAARYIAEVFDCKITQGG